MVPRTNFGSQNRSPRTDFGSQNWFPLAKNSPPTDHDACTDRIWLPGLILAAKIDPPPCQSPTDRDARTEFGKQDLLANNYTFSYL